MGYLTGILTLCFLSRIAPSACRSEPIHQPQFQETIEVTKGEELSLSCQISHIIGEFAGCYWSAKPDVNGRSDFDEVNSGDEYELKVTKVVVPAEIRHSSISCSLTIKSVAYEHGRLWQCHISDTKHTYSSHLTKVVVHSPGLDGELYEIRNNLSHVWKELQSLRAQRLPPSAEDEHIVEQIMQTLKLSQDPYGFMVVVNHVTELKVSYGGSLGNSSRPASSGIYHLSTLSTKGNWGKFVDSVGFAFWHMGSTHIFHIFHEDGQYESVRLGNPLVDANASFMITIPHDTWYITTIDKEYGHYVLESVSMTPAWTPDHWIKGEKEDIEELFPSHRQVINNLSGTD